MRDRRWLKRFWLLFLTVLIALSASFAHSDAPVLPHRAWLPGFGGSCDGGPLSCTRIDELALSHRDTDHVGGAQALVAILPPAQLRRSAH